MTDRDVSGDAAPNPFTEPAMDLDNTQDATAVHLDDIEEWVIERAVLNDDRVGREIAARFVRVFGALVANEVRPLLREVSQAGGEPQLLVNGLAALLRTTADSIEFPLDHPRSSAPSSEEDR